MKLNERTLRYLFCLMSKHRKLFYSWKLHLNFCLIKANIIHVDNHSNMLTNVLKRTNRIKNGKIWNTSCDRAPWLVMWGDDMMNVLISIGFIVISRLDNTWKPLTEAFSFRELAAPSCLNFRRSKSPIHIFAASETSANSKSPGKICDKMKLTAFDHSGSSFFSMMCSNLIKNDPAFHGSKVIKWMFRGKVAPTAEY